MRRGSGNWGVGGRTPGIAGRCPGLGVGTYMPLTPKHEQRVERQTARKKNQSSAQGPAEAASFTYRRRASSCGESLGWEEQEPFLLAASETSAAPKGPPGDMGGPVREPALSVALWLSWGAALGAVACAMVLLTQQTELQTLRREVTRLQRTGGPSEKGEGYLWLSLREQSSDGVEARENGERSRRRRAVLTKKQKKDSDVTEVMWQPALWRGRGLEAQGYVIRVWDAGVYLLYSQVLFHDVTFTMGQVVSREGQGRQETLFRCIRSMPSNPDWAYNSCYSAGVFHLHQGDTLSVIIPRARAKLSLSPHGTFLGLVKL
ncbi:tumor necrosis factor ligand superfamily member 13 isoform X2 [Balaenoptera acutorostrata]|uniref:Tumor necrosis factor ligand superfamily member 13 isoform X2 n=1 Tax=Balaenoptera acutorostrata TaxID=9767 RepID=A0ABM3SQ45_BALAC|nr:tumor necrosis factor ligand superfamily member 13 isoform X2 [Balaenoptera acutorostrata]